MKRSLVFAITAIITISLLMAGCSGTNKSTEIQSKQEQNQVINKGPEEKEVAGSKPGDFFPLAKGATWLYYGEGNEFAFFSSEVLFAKGNRFQIRDDNGGTVIAMIFEITDDAVTRTFYSGEMYDYTNLLDRQPNDNTIIIKAPIKVGTKWKEKDAEREIVDIDASVATPLGTYQNCIKVKIAGKHSTVFEYYKRGIGMVKREFISGDTRVSSILKEYNKKTINNGRVIRRGR